MLDLELQMETEMPGWSPEIANEFIRMAAIERRALNQVKLQYLVYIAHGWCLASYDEPLTGDRPEACEFGPMYKKLADALVRYGTLPVIDEIRNSEAFPDYPSLHGDSPARADLQQFECDLLAKIYGSYGSLESGQLATVSSGGDAPWRQVFADGAGKCRDIPHNFVKAQFLELLSKFENQIP